MNTCFSSFVFFVVGVFAAELIGHELDHFLFQVDIKGELTQGSLWGNFPNDKCGTHFKCLIKREREAGLNRFSLILRKQRAKACVYTRPWRLPRNARNSRSVLHLVG